MSTGEHTKSNKEAEMSKVRVVSLSMDGVGYTVRCEEMGALYAELDEASRADEDAEYTVRFHEMDEAELDALPEFEGF